MASETPLRCLLPEPGATTIGELFAGFDPAAGAGADRPYVFTNFALTVDGHATIDGRSGAIGTDTDTAMLVALRTHPDAVMIGAGTLRAEGYGRVVSDPAKRELRESRGLSPDPLMVLVSNRLEIPWEAPLFTDGGGRVLIFTASAAEPPADRDARSRSSATTATSISSPRSGPCAATTAFARCSARAGRPSTPSCSPPGSSTSSSSPARRRSPAAPAPASSPASRPTPASSSSSGWPRPAASSTPATA